ncbi:helix-turn-helix domain-containing protein [Alkalicoccus daliensis]|uniref:Helix-turn-helix domain-containing protein n=1 Tax=Alkalicoccus daliensis TaxID=745820 RepID=A0A1H0DX76_9BACI|nr:helix-turn-helix transcriptional regulator [Alkalicoccus daliensis]SDN74668.1 Helix-turn-helix domain-containing protein [Alkalicoccus daliensis]
MSGKLLKYNRIKQRKKQEEICAGICSVSYYSKIENDKIEPADDLLMQLLERLHITKEELSNVDEKEIRLKLAAWHKSIIYEQVRTAEKYKGEITEQIDFFQNREIQLLHSLISIRYFILKKHERLIEDFIKRADSISSEELSEETRFYYFMIMGEAAGYYEDYEKAKRNMQTACNMINSLIMKKHVLEDFYLLMGKTVLETGDYTLSIRLINKALTSFDQRYALLQSGRGRVILARALRLSGNFEDTAAELEKAEKISGQIKNQQLLARMLQEQGELYAQQNEAMKAIQSFQQSYRLRTGRERLAPIHGILMQFEIMNAPQDIISWVNHGVETIQALRREQAYTQYEKKYELKFLYYLYKYDGASSHKFEGEMKKTILPFFEEKQDMISLAYYYERMGEFYAANNLLEESIAWYQKAMKALWKRTLH